MRTIPLFSFLMLGAVALSLLYAADLKAEASIVESFDASREIPRDFSFPGQFRAAPDEPELDRMMGIEDDEFGAPKKAKAPETEVQSDSDFVQQVLATSGLRKGEPTPEEVVSESKERPFFVEAVDRLQISKKDSSINDENFSLFPTEDYLAPKQAPTMASNTLPDPQDSLEKFEIADTGSSPRSFEVLSPSDDNDNVPVGSLTPSSEPGEWILKDARLGDERRIRDLGHNRYEIYRGTVMVGFARQVQDGVFEFSSLDGDRSHTVVIPGVKRSNP